MVSFGLAPIKHEGIAQELYDYLEGHTRNWCWPTSENPPCDYVERRIPCHLVDECQKYIDYFLIHYGYNPESI